MCLHSDYKIYIKYHFVFGTKTPAENPDKETLQLCLPQYVETE